MDNFQIGVIWRNLGYLATFPLFLLVLACIIAVCYYLILIRKGGRFQCECLIPMWLRNLLETYCGCLFSRRRGVYYDVYYDNDTSTSCCGGRNKTTQWKTTIQPLTPAEWAALRSVAKRWEASDWPSIRYRPAVMCFKRAGRRKTKSLLLKLSWTSLATIEDRSQVLSTCSLCRWTEIETSRDVMWDKKMCSPGWGLNCFALVSGIAPLIFHEFYVAHDSCEFAGRDTVCFNPNLYSNGKVCLSLLGTWQGPKCHHGLILRERDGDSNDSLEDHPMTCKWLGSPPHL